MRPHLQPPPDVRSWDCAANHAGRALVLALHDAVGDLDEFIKKAGAACDDAAPAGDHLIGGLLFYPTACLGNDELPGQAIPRVHVLFEIPNKSP